MKIYEHAIEISMKDGSTVYVPLAFNEPERSERLAEMYSEDKYKNVVSDTIESYHVVRREVGEWESYGKHTV